MESKIFIDINYASRAPQIVIRQKDSEDPRDKLIAMLLGEGMPGVSDGYCRIERYSDQQGTCVAVITAISPIDMIKHIPTIAELAHKNAACDMSGVPDTYRSIIEDEYQKLKDRRMMNSLATCER